MMQVYINYPNPHITKHADPSCGLVRSQRKSDQRIVRVTAENALAILAAFERGDYRFGATKATNDLWLDLALATRQEEDAFVERLRGILGQRYAPLGRAPISEHCP